MSAKDVHAGNIGMGGTSKKPPNGDRTKKPPPKPVDDDEEDGDMATPKRDRNGDDDQPL
jgi:hypothetical protein